MINSTTESFITLMSQRGVDPATGDLVADPVQRIRQLFANIKEIAEESGTAFSEVVRFVVYVADMARDRPLVNQVQEEIWGVDSPYFPPRTIVEVDYLGDDFIEVDAIFRVPRITSEEIEYLKPEGAFTPTGTWSLGVKTDGHVFVAGMRGINPETNELVIGSAPRIRQAFENMKLIAEAGGAALADAINLVVYVTDEKHLEVVEGMQQRYWENKPLPPVAINVVTALNDDDYVEIEGSFVRPA